MLISTSKPFPSEVVKLRNQKIAVSLVPDSKKDKSV